jgi:pilus assembly protein CpaC
MEISRKNCTLGLMLAALMLTAAPVTAQQAELTISSAAYGAMRHAEVQLNKSMIVDLPAGVAEVIVSQPGVAAAIMRTRTRAIVQGISSGETNIFFLDDAGRTIQVLDMRVIEEPSQIGTALQTALARVIPGSRIAVEAVELAGATSRVVLTGTVLTSEDRDRAISVATQFAGSPENVASIIDIVGAQQVMLQVTVSEIRRDVAKQLGINLSGSATIGSTTLGFNSNQLPTATPFTGTGSFPGANFSIQASVTALEERGALRLLAQPTLTALSGETAEFLVGGEFPIPSTSANGTTIQYKDYGIELNFTPTVRSNGNVSLQLETGVSEVQAGSYSLSRRDVKTSVELPPGTTLAVGGLLDERSSRSIDQLPGLGNIPILGALFRSNEYRSQQTELVVLVTPYLVQPSQPGTIPVPTDEHLIANDSEAFFLGALESRYGVGATGEFRGSFSGSVGFALD